MKPEISVITCCYNQQESIARAIKSVQDQILPSDEVEHIIVDDGSTDGTVKEIERAIINARFNIRFYKNIKNIGIMQTYGFALSKCEGEYISFCDGDDYWINSNKLMLQRYYLITRLNMGLCLTQVCLESGGRRIETAKNDIINKNLSYDSILRGKAHIYAQSLMIRKSLLKYVDFNKFIRNRFVLWDYPIVLELIRHTNFHCMGFCSAVFVIRDESVTHTRSRIKRFKYLFGIYKIRMYYIIKYGCKPSTFLYLCYKLVRDFYSIIFKRWYK